MIGAIDAPPAGSASSVGHLMLSTCATLSFSNHALGDTARPFPLHEHVTGLKIRIMQGKHAPQTKTQLRLCLRTAGTTSVNNSKTLLLLPATNMDPLEVIIWEQV